MSSSYVYILDRSGADGQPGANGTNGVAGQGGRNGLNGMNGGREESRMDGFNGQDGQPGTNGLRGTDASNGQSGQNGGNGNLIKVKLIGDSNQKILVQVNNAQDRYISIPDNTQKAILLKGNGGNGGQGGNGGNGGPGGAGGSGGWGGVGGPGQNASQWSIGGNGGAGGNGGKGGDGGNGGAAGHGGMGGDGGDGSNIEVETYNPGLLKFVTWECRAGMSGKGGSGGQGGQGGAAGNGGLGGAGGPGGAQFMFSDQNGMLYCNQGGFPGRMGMHGEPGAPGLKGVDGTDARDGRDGRPGQVIFKVLDQYGNAMEVSDNLYDLQVDSFAIIPCGVHTENFQVNEDDGIIEPGETIYICDIQVQNVGGMTLPENTLLSAPTTMPSSRENFHPFIAAKGVENFTTLPTIPKGGIFKVPSYLKGYVAAATPPEFVKYNYLIGYENPPPPRFKKEMKIETLGSIFNSPFEKSKCSSVFTVQYPIQIETIVGPSHLGKNNERATVTIRFSNISNLDYGASVDAHKKLSLSIYFDNKFMILNERNVLERDNMQYVHEHIDLIQAKRSYERHFQLSIQPSAEYFERLRISAHLLLRDQTIEISEHLIRVSPSYEPCTNTVENPHDLLFITDRHLSRVEYLRYMRLFDGCGLRVNYWDIERYNGISIDANTGTRHEFSWTDKSMYQGKTIIFPLPDERSIHLLNPKDIFSVLRNLDENNTKNTRGGILLLGNLSCEQIRDFLFASSDSIHLPEQLLSERFFTHKATFEDLQKICNKFMHELEEEHPSKIYKLHDVKFEPTKTGIGKYLLGSAQYSVLPSSACDNLYSIQVEDNSSAHFLSKDNISWTETNFPMQSHVATTLIGIIFSLSPQRRVELLATPNLKCKSEQWNIVKEYQEREKKLLVTKRQEYSIYDIISLSFYYDMHHDVTYKDIATSIIAPLIMETFEKRLGAFKGMTPFEKVKVSQCMWYAFKHIKHDFKWTAIFSSMKHKKKQFKVLCSQLEDLLFKNILTEKQDKKIVKKHVKMLLCSTQYLIKLNNLKRPLLTPRQEDMEEDHKEAKSKNGFAPTSDMHSSFVAQNNSGGHHLV